MGINKSSNQAAAAQWRVLARWCQASPCAIAIAWPSHHVQSHLLCRLIMYSRACSAVALCAAVFVVPFHHAQSHLLCRLIICSCALSVKNPTYSVMSESDLKPQAPSVIQRSLQLFERFE
jgi:hypothetical protein